MLLTFHALESALVGLNLASLFRHRSGQSGNHRSEAVQSRIGGLHLLVRFRLGLSQLGI